MADLILRGSEYSDFLNCRKKWFYSWVEGIEPKRPDNKLFFGTVFHKWLETYYNNECNKLMADMVTTAFINAHDTSGMEQTELDELMKLMKGVCEHYDKIYGERDKELKILGTEVEFLVKLQEDIFMTGTIDLVYEVDGKVRFMDHKTVSSIQMYVDKAQMDRQISRYWWALNMISAGIGRIKSKETGDWIRWEELIDKEVDGFDYNLIAKDYPREPKVLKSGKLSTDKSQKTTFDLYIKKIAETNQEMHLSDYNEMLEYLKDKPEQFLRRLPVYRTQQELEAAAWEFLYTAGDIHDVKLMLKEAPQNTETMTYRNIGNQCHTMCQFKELCKTTIEGGNVSLVKNLLYKKKDVE